MTHPTFEDCTGIKLSCYSFENFIGFNNLFQASELCVWENKWSEYNASSTNSTIEYVQNISQEDESFQTIFRAYNELKLNKYDQTFIPYTYGLSFEFISEKNTLLFLSMEKIPDEINQLLSKESLEKQNMFLVKSGILDKEENANTIEDVVSNLKSDLLERLIKESGKVVCLWFATYTDSLTCLTAFQKKYDQISVLSSEELSNKDLKPAIKRLFESFTLK